MAGFSELIKNFDKTRDYVRDFFIYGCKVRSDFDRKSVRTYGDEKRRVESWMGDSMRYDDSVRGRSVSISVDSGHIPENPLYNAYYSKSFTDNDIRLHFLIMDILEDITCVIFTPVSAFLSSYGLVQTADDWNLHCVSQSSPRLSAFYYNYYLHTFIILFILSCLILLFRFIRKAGTKRSKNNSISHLLAPGFWLCIIIALWFSIGDGAPPNDRYALLHYIIWTLWVLGIISPELFSF